MCYCTLFMHTSWLFFWRLCFQSSSAAASFLFSALLLFSTFFLALHSRSLNFEHATCCFPALRLWSVIERDAWARLERRRWFSASLPLCVEASAQTHNKLGLHQYSCLPKFALTNTQQLVYQLRRNRLVCQPSASKLAIFINYHSSFATKMLSVYFSIRCAGEFRLVIGFRVFLNFRWLMALALLCVDFCADYLYSK